MIIVFIFISCIVAYLIFKQAMFTRQKLKSDMLLLTIEKSNDFYYYVKIKPRLEYIYLSDSFENFFGPGSLKDHLLHPYDAYVRMSHPDDMPICDAKITGTADYSQPLNVRLLTADGTYKWFEEFATPIYENGEFVALHGLYREINDTMHLQNKFEKMRDEDQMTGVKNRLYYEDQLRIYNEKLNTSLGLIVCNMDFTKELNYNYGFDVSNHLIKNLAMILSKASSHIATVCRTNGDEFTLIYPNCSQDQFEQFLNHIRREIANFNHSSHAFKLNVSIGGSHTQSSIDQISKLTLHAEHKMDSEKERHKLFAQTIKTSE